MSTVHASIEIAAPVEEVWETIMDPNRLGDWVTIHKSVSKVTNAGEPGATMEQCLHMRGVSFKVKWELAEMRSATARGVGRTRSRAIKGAHPVRLSSHGDGKRGLSTPMSSTRRAECSATWRAESSSAQHPSARRTTRCRR